MKLKKFVLVMFVLVTLVLPCVLSALPCYDKWQGCNASGASSDFCEGLWQGCMYATYGYSR